MVIIGYIVSYSIKAGETADLENRLTSLEEGLCKIGNRGQNLSRKVEIDG